MPAEGLPWLERSAVLTLRGDRARRRAAGRRWACSDVRLTGGEPLVRRDFPRLAGDARRGSRASSDLSVTTNGFLLERDAAALVEAGVQRFNVSIDSLQRDRFFEMTRRDALPQVLRGLEALAAFPQAHPIKVNAVAMRGFTEDEVLPFARVRARASLRGPLHRVHAARRRPRLDAGQRPDRRARSARSIDDRASRSSPSRASRARPRASTASPTARAGSASSTRSASRSAATATASASPPRAGCARACSRSTRPTCAGRCAPGASDDELEQLIRDAVWRKELKHHVNEPGFIQPRAHDERYRRLSSASAAARSSALLTLRRRSASTVSRAGRSASTCGTARPAGSNPASSSSACGS